MYIVYYSFSIFFIFSVLKFCFPTHKNQTLPKLYMWIWHIVQPGPLDSERLMFDMEEH